MVNNVRELLFPVFRLISKMVLKSQRFCKGIDNLEGQFVKILSRVVKLYRIQLVNSLKITLATIIYSVAEILVIFHNSKINWFVEGGACKLPLVRLRHSS